MGFRHRKSINLGGGFKINLSKSGVGYSWGVKGYRVTKKPNGNIRYTTSIPGTGISWVEETSGKNNSQSNENNRHLKRPINNNHYDTEDITNADASKLISEGLEAMLKSAKLSLTLNRITNIGFVLTLIMSFANPLALILLFSFIALKIYIVNQGIIELNYTIDDDQKEIVEGRTDQMIRVTTSNKVWRIMQSSKVIHKKYEAGASESVKLKFCKATTKPPFPFKTNVQVASFKAGNEILLFLPDKLFVIQGIKIGALNYTDVISDAHTTRFIECASVPRDALVIDHTWKFVNKSGGPDKRFKNNRKFPVCLYGEITLESTLGLNTIIMFSNINLL